MTPAINQAREAIEQQLEPLLLELTALEKNLTELKQTEAQLKDALKALTKTGNTKSRKVSKPYAKKATVMKACLAIAKDNSPILKSDLELLVKDKLGKDMGYSLSGVQLRLGECLASEQFEIGADGMVSVELQNNRHDRH